MTHDILPSDVDLANKMRSGGHSDEDVITALVHRGIDQSEAEQLLDDLRNGRSVKTKLQQGLEMTPRRRHRERRRAEGHDRHSGEDREHRSRKEGPEHSHSPSSRGESSQEAEPSREASPARPQKKRRFKFWPWVVILLVCAVAAFGRLAFFNHGHSPWANRFNTRASAREVPGARESGPDTVAARESHLDPGELTLEFRPDGMYLDGMLLTRENALKVTAAVLGAPTRTTPGKESGAVNYAFDDYGMVVCGQGNGARGSILLDCDGVGGASGATAGFKGELRVADGGFVRADTACQELAGMKTLQLNSSGLESGILDGRYQNVDLVFVYLKSRSHLSLIEIDFK